MSAGQNFRVASFLAGKAIKVPVVLVTTANVVTLVGAQTIETVVLAIGDRVLLAAQTDPIDNGIYTVEQAAWNRAGDWDGNRDATNGTLISSVQNGAVELWELQTSDDPFEPGTSDGVFAQAVAAIEGSFTVDWDGFAAPVQSTIQYRKSGNLVHLEGSGVISGTSNAITKDCAAGEVPLALRPINNTGRGLAFALDNGGAWVASTVVVFTDGHIAVNATPFSGVWTASGSALFEWFDIWYYIE